MPKTNAYLLSRLFRWFLIALCIWSGWTIASGVIAVKHKAAQRLDSRIDVIDRAVS